MRDTLSNLIDLQLERVHALPNLPDNPLRLAALEGIRNRNAMLDAIFYDVAALSKSELPLLAFWLAREGAYLLVPPTDGADVQVFAHKADLVQACDGKAAAVVVAGVGSSAVGAAAFARNIADALGGPVVAVVSGYGLSDVLTEALGGFFWFGALNSVRHQLEMFDEQSRKLGEGWAAGDASDPRLARLSRDTAALITLLADSAFQAPFLIGHSKGNLVVSEALYAIQRREGLATLSARTQIVTFSAKVGMPAEFAGRVFDVMGQWDSFGALNSRPDIRADYVVPGAWHSTNPSFPFGMGIDVTHTMRTILPLLGGQSVSPFGAEASLVFDLPQQSVGVLASA